MDKKNFINYFKDEDKNILSKLYDKIILSEKTNTVVFTNEFLSPNVWFKLNDLKNNFFVDIDTFGIFNDSERRMVAFYTSDAPKTFPLSLIKIINKSKFRKLNHRDYLGAIMSLGIKREKMGDLVIVNDICYGAVCSDICDYIKYNLNMIANCPCKIEVIQEYDYNGIKKMYCEKTIIISSFRVDCVIASICNISRKKVVKLINSGKVLVNYNTCFKKNINIEVKNIITIRGYGKYKIGENLGVTSKNRFKLKILKYI